MLRKLTLINYMSHAHTEIDFAKGLTVIAGENNCGKSAIVSALQAVCSNATGDYMVRHGEKECRVILETDDDQVIEWRRAKGKVSYVVNGEAIDRTHGQVPERVASALRMPKVEAENSEFDVHFGEQKSPIFLLDGTPSQRAAFFASSSDAAKLIQMQTLHKARVTDSTRNLRSLQNRDVELQQEFETLNILPQIESDLQAIELFKTQLSEKTDRQEKIDVCLGRLNSQQAECELLTRTIETFRSMPIVPQLRETGELEELLRTISLMGSVVHRESETVELLEDVPSRPMLKPETDLTRCFQELIATHDQVDQSARSVEALELPEKPELTSESFLDQLVNELKQHERHVEQLEVAFDLVADVNQPRLDEIELPLSRQINQINELMDDISELQQESDMTLSNVRDARQRLDSLLGELKKCPTCGQEIAVCSDHSESEQNDGK